ncbi:MAG: hypothetical protein WB778_04265 [Thermoplasmata archaeon]
MPFPELLEGNPGFHLKRLLHIPSEIVWGYLVHQVGQRVRRALPADLVIA